MKKLLLFILVFASCSNQRNEIIKRENEIQYTLTILKERLYSLKETFKQKEHQLYVNRYEKGDTTGYDVADSIIVDEYGTAAVTISSQINSLNIQYDSLERELKKY